MKKWEIRETETIDDFGRVQIPKEIRRELNLKEGTQIDIILRDTGTIIMRRHRGEAEKKFMEAFGKFTEDIAGLYNELPSETCDVVWRCVNDMNEITR